MHHVDGFGTVNAAATAIARLEVDDGTPALGVGEFVERDSLDDTGRGDEYEMLVSRRDEREDLLAFVGTENAALPVHDGPASMRRRYRGPSR